MFSRLPQEYIKVFLLWIGGVCTTCNSSCYTCNAAGN